MARTTTNAAARIPNIVKHCTIAILKDRNIRGSELERFATAMKYAVSRLSEYGYLTSSSKEAAADKVQLTPQGSARDRYHSSEGKQKSALFDKLYEAHVRAQTRTVNDRNETKAPPPTSKKKKG